jgi:aromatic ring-cleaving dioxygenase
MDCGGDTAYVFIAMIVLSDENGILKHTAESLSRVICKDVESVKRAVTHLESEDPESNLKAHEGRRIVRLHELNEDETRGWLVVNKSHYRDQKDLEEIRTQTRERVRRFRERNAEKRDVTLGNAEKRHTDTDTDTKTLFVKFWEAYPKKVGKQDASKAFSRMKFANGDFEHLIAALEKQKQQADWTREGGRFIPHPATWLNGRRFEDEGTAVPAKPWTP